MANSAPTTLICLKHGDCAIWVTACAALLLLLAGVLSWLATLHRSTKGLPPGPTSVPVFGNWLQVGDQITARNMAKLAQKYGDIFLLQMGRRKLVVVSSPDLAKEMLATRSLEFSSRASNIVFDIFSGKGKDLAIAEYGEHWRRARRVVSVPMFTKAALERWRHCWEQEIDLLVGRLGARCLELSQLGKPSGVFLRDTLQFMVYNIVYSMIFGHHFESEDDALYKELKHLNDERGRLVQNLSYNYGDFHSLLEPFLWGYLRTCHKVKIARERLFKNFITEYLRSEKRQNGTFGIDLMIAAIENGEMKEEHVLCILENLNSAGIPTVSITLEWAIAELVNNPQIQERIYAELINVLGAGADLTEGDISRLPYLQAVLKETMRFHTTVPLVVPRLNLKEAKLGGYHIPAKCKMILNSWWLANNPENWKQPEKYNPDRFLHEEANVEMNGSSFKFLPFGFGRRQCPGYPLALPIMHLTIGKLVQKFRLMLPDGEGSPDHKMDMSEVHGQFLNMMAVPPEVRLESRDAPSTPLLKASPA